jgi:hypothetical protein
VVLRADGTASRIPFVRWANVFNLDQTEGIQAPALTATQSASSTLEKAAAIVENATLCHIHHAGFAASYSPADDMIRIPATSTFHSREDYYHTLCHEMIHASGHSSRLNREGVSQPVRFGSERYCKEELVGELGAAFLSNEACIPWRTCAWIAPICILPSGRAGGESLPRPPSERLQKSAPSRAAWLRPPIHCVLTLPPRHPAPGGTNRLLHLPCRRPDTPNDPRLFQPLRPSSYFRSNTG